MALRKVKGALEHVLDKNLQDLVRGIRNHKDSEGKYISECIEEIKLELKQDTIVVKANAINKLVYLQMLGYDISWAGFNIVEVMSSPKFTYKRIGYLAASQSFHDGTDVIMLTTNLVRKDLNSTNTYDAGVALSSLSCFMTGDLAHDLANDIMVLMTSTKPYLRKKAVLLMYKVFLRFPDSLKPAFGRLKEKLEDPDPGVQSAAVNVICELARKNPQNYLSLAPLFFKLMTTSTNNWVLIKIIKLFGALIPLEPRLGKKLIEPLTNLIHSTSAMSLLYECINTVIAVLISISSGLQNHATSVQLCVQKLQILIEDSDQNLKYLGLLAMTKILKTHPKSVQAHKELIMQCLDDKDESIRLRALSLLYGMVSKKNLMEIVKKLILHMEKAEGAHYRDELLSKIIGICSQNDYRFITNFEWYVSVLVELAANKGMKPSQGRAIASQLLDVAIRVQQVRRFTARQMSLLLRNHTQLLGGATGRQAGLLEVLYAAAWICGEFASCLVDNDDDEEAGAGGEDWRRATLEAMSLPYVAQLPGEVQAVFVHNQLKLYASLLVSGDGYGEDEDEGDDDEEGEEKESPRVALTTDLLGKLEQFVHSDDLEVQERAVGAHQLLKCAAKALRAADQAAALAAAAELSALFAGELNPVAPKAQRKVPLPEGLDLDAWINAPPASPLPPKSKGAAAALYDSDEGAAAGGGSGRGKQSRRKKQQRREEAVPLGGDGGGGGGGVGGGFTSYSSSDLGVHGVGGGGGSATYHQPSESELAEMRESRLRQQASNPNYLRPSASASELGGGGGGGRQRSDYEVPDAAGSAVASTIAGFGEDDNNDEGGQLPPVASLDPSLPSLRLEGLTSSDQYLKQHREMLQAKRAQKKKAAAEAAAAAAAVDTDDDDDDGEGDGKKKKRKGKKKKQLLKKRKSAKAAAAAGVVGDDDDDDDDIPVAHAVSTAFDMPEGAAPDSDGERGGGGAERNRLAPDDPHRLLADIKLDDIAPARQPPPTAAEKSPLESPAKKKKKAGKKAKKSEEGAAEEAAAPGKKKKKKTKATKDDGDGEAATSAGPKKTAKKAKKKKGAEDKGAGDLMLLSLDDEPAAPPAAKPQFAVTVSSPSTSPPLWLTIGESLTVRLDVSWRRAADSADCSRVDLAFRLVPLASGADAAATTSSVIKSATLELEGRGGESIAFVVSSSATATATATGVDGDTLARPEGKLRVSVTVRWGGGDASESLRVRLPRLCRLLPVAIDSERLQADLGAGGHAQASARLEGRSFADWLARLGALAHPVDVQAGAAATLHCRAAGSGAGGGASLYLLLKRLGGGSSDNSAKMTAPPPCGLEAKSTDAQLAADSVSEVKKLLGRATIG